MAKLTEYLKGWLSGDTRDETSAPQSEPPAYVSVIEYSLRYRILLKRIAIPLLLLLIAAVSYLVYQTGGIKYVYAHSMYLVILSGGFILGARGGALVGLIAGLALGPLMPIDIQTGEMQKTFNWMFRAGFFISAGFLCGLLSDLGRRYLAYYKWFIHHDNATGLANRLALIEQMNFMTAQEKDQNRQALLVLSLDNATEIEGVYGPEVTDEIIRQLSQRVGERFGQELSPYRLFSHQLCIVFPHPDEGELERLLSGLADEFGSPFTLGTLAVHGDIRMGFTELSQRIAEPEHCLRQVELALRNASERSQRWVCFTPDLDGMPLKENLELLSELKNALSSNQLTLHYQPKVSLKSGKIRGAEALVRWQHPTRGYIPPSKFIPRAEQSTLIDQLTYWVIDAALEQTARWRKQGIELNIAVNISTRNLLQPEFTDRVIAMVKQYQLTPHRLELEVTEGSIILDTARTVSELNRLADAGIVISIDDFGTGYSSLQYLNELPASLIKIDQSFVKTLSGNRSSAHIVKAAIGMAHNLGKEVIAEGVETVSAYEYLAEIDCDVAQGYLISRPIPADQFTEWYRLLNGEFHTRENGGA